MFSDNYYKLLDNLPQVLEVLSTKTEKKDARRFANETSLELFHTYVWEEVKKKAISKNPDAEVLDEVASLIHKRAILLKACSGKRHMDSIEFIGSCCSKMFDFELTEEDDWFLSFDASNDSGSGDSGLGCVLVNAESKQAFCFMVKSIQPDAHSAEQAALEFGLRAALSFNAKSIRVKGDAKNVIDRCMNHLHGKRQTKAKASHVRENFLRIYDLIKEFQRFEAEWVPRELNSFANHLSRMARDRQYHGHKPMLTINLSELAFY